MNTTEKYQALRAEYISAQAEYQRAAVALDKARRDYVDSNDDVTLWEVFSLAQDVYDKTLRAERKAWGEYYKAWQAYKEKHG